MRKRRPASRRNPAQHTWEQAAGYWKGMMVRPLKQRQIFTPGAYQQRESEQGCHAAQVQEVAAHSTLCQPCVHGCVWVTCLAAHGAWEQLPLSTAGAPPGAVSVKGTVCQCAAAVWMRLLHTARIHVLDTCSLAH